jgi:predicted alpha/beta hydrolase family esterase
MGRDGDGEQRYQRCHSIADPTFRRVIQDDWLRHKLADWVTRLEEEGATWADSVEI